MKKLLLIIIVSLSLQSCATVFGGRITECQKRKPLPGEAKKEFRPVPLILNILFFPTGLIGLAIDISNGSAYKPCDINKSVNK